MGRSERLRELAERGVKLALTGRKSARRSELRDASGSGEGLRPKPLTYYGGGSGSLACRLTATLRTGGGTLSRSNSFLAQSGDRKHIRIF